MPSTENLSKANSWWESFQRVWRPIEEKSRLALLGLLALFVLLFEWHLIPVEWVEGDGRIKQVVVTVLVVMAAGIIKVIFDTREAVDKLSETVKEISQGFSMALKPLRECTQDLSNRLGSVQPGDKVIIDHLGLDMNHAWDYVRQFILKHPQLRDVELRVLMLTGDAEKLGSVIPNEVQDWCLRISSSLKKIQTSLTNESLSGQWEGKRLKVEVKQYNVLPTVHGFSVRQPFKVQYISFCRWKDSEYVWGEDSYRTIVDLADSVLKDESDLFEGNFEYLWSIGETVLMISYPQAQRVSS